MKINMGKSQWLVWAAIGVGIGAAPAHASALYTYSIESVSAASPSSGDAFEVDLTNNSGAAVDVDSFEFGLNMPNANFIITGADCNTAVNTYIFAGNSFFCPALASNILPDTTLNAGDLWAGAGNGFSLGAGVTVALGEVYFSVAAGVAPGGYTVSFIPAEDSLSDITGAPIGPINDSGTGTITVSSLAVPEPSTMALLGLTLLPLAWARKRSRS
jgi:PEP-CTERM motif